eukprot:TRINITY_DN18167_c0_g1_i2.p1 TRINITY_DN18167_c0_g1~~TRINITY_DN18167_c0_g1_i2.p1  ORF type:complete len:244 (-),score=52.29 TRINITY_DN18167_c0_g1_i2:29-760(-)
MASSELLAGLHSLRKWADDNNDHFRLQDRQQAPAQQSPSPPRSPVSPSHRNPSLSNVRASLKELRQEAPRWIPTDVVASSPLKDMGAGSPQFVAQAEASRMQYAIKRRRMKPMPSMPTHADIISAVVRLQKDATQSLESEVEVRKTLDFLSTLSSTLLHAFSSMVGISEQVMADTEQARAEVSQVADEMRSFHNDTIRQMGATIDQNSAQLDAVMTELRALRGDPSTPQVGGGGSLADGHATT